jgi:hypothetical protein
MLVLGYTAASAQRVPATSADLAQPGGKFAGAPKLALAKVADGFHDPVGVTAANDGSGRIFVVERAGRVRVVDKSGKVLAEPFIDLNNFNPLVGCADRVCRTGALVNCTAPEVQGQRSRFLSLHANGIVCHGADGTGKMGPALWARTWSTNRC